MNEPNWADIAGVIAAAVEALAVVGALIFAARQLSLTRKSREDEAAEASEALKARMRPYVVVHLEGAIVSGVVNIVVENLGRTPAFGITFEVDPPIDGSVRFPENLSVLADGIPVLAPSQRLVFIFDWVFDRDESLPMTWSARTAYLGSDGATFAEMQVLDMEHLWGIEQLQRKDMHDVAKELEKIRKELHNWTSSAGGLRVVNPIEEVDHHERRRRHQQEYLAERAAEAEGTTPDP